MEQTPIRPDGRKPDQLRPLRLTTDFIDHAEGSVLVEMGRTRVVCTATIENKVPPWMRNGDSGWLTAEYSMLPRAGKERTPRESVRGRIKGRTHEIQRLIGRSIRAAVDLKELKGKTICLDCDVLQADGGTRTASVTGAWVATALAMQGAAGARGDWREIVRHPVAAVSVGSVQGRVLLDLCYEEDVRADVDMNVVMTGDGRFVEVQGTAEGAPFDRAAHDQLLDYAAAGIEELIGRQLEALG
ncbi:MAG: ribonuclease PH [Gemmatimonadetes bacterium]|nr:ribonuclease PH [Gemmatimonadota bacterium]